MILYAYYFDYTNESNVNINLATLTYQMSTYISYIHGEVLEFIAYDYGGEKHVMLNKCQECGGKFEQDGFDLVCQESGEHVPMDGVDTAVGHVPTPVEYSVIDSIASISNNTRHALIGYTESD